jgi:hypothetical protein
LFIILLKACHTRQTSFFAITDPFLKVIKYFRSERTLLHLLVLYLLGIHLRFAFYLLLDYFQTFCTFGLRHAVTRRINLWLMCGSDGHWFWTKMVFMITARHMLRNLVYLRIKHTISVYLCLNQIQLLVSSDRWCVVLPKQLLHVRLVLSLLSHNSRKLVDLRSMSISLSLIRLLVRLMVGWVGWHEIVNGWFESQFLM